jgi:hypothetical protein
MGYGRVCESCIVLVDLGESLNLLSVIVYDIVPHSKWADKNSSSRMSNFSWFFNRVIEHLVHNHLFLCFGMKNNSENLVGIVFSSYRLIVTPVGMWEGFILHW